MSLSTHHKVHHKSRGTPHTTYLAPNPTVIVSHSNGYMIPMMIGVLILVIVITNR